MINYVKGDLLSTNTEALVNTVNTVGVMGKGIALQFKEKYPNNFNQYFIACKKGEMKPGKLLVVRENTLEENKIIINFPTKVEWFKKSQYSYIEDGLKALINTINDYNIKDIAIPPLGCGNGGLKWDKVRDLIEKYLGSLPNTTIYVFEPNDEIKELLKKQESNKEVKLTDSKAMLLYAMFYYESLGEKSSLFVANKLAYFLKRLGENSFKRLNFKASHYGPYSVQVDHLVQSVNGKYIRGLEQMKVTPFEEITLEYDKAPEISQYVRTKLDTAQIGRLNNLINLIDGYQSAFALEVLASVDFIRKDNPRINEENTFIKIQEWSERKKNLFNKKQVSTAYNHLERYASMTFMPSEQK